MITVCLYKEHCGGLTTNKASKASSLPADAYLKPQSDRNKDKIRN